MYEKFQATVNVIMYTNLLCCIYMRSKMPNVIVMNLFKTLQIV